MPRMSYVIKTDLISYIREGVILLKLEDGTDCVEARKVAV